MTYSEISVGYTVFCEICFLVPKPLLGNALAEKPRLLLMINDPKQGLRVQRHSQAGAWERGSLGLGTRKQTKFLEET